MSDTPFTIRPATRGDAEALGRLGARLVEMHHDFDGQRFMAPTAGTARGYGGYLAGQIDDPDTIDRFLYRSSATVHLEPRGWDVPGARFSRPDGTPRALAGFVCLMGVLTFVSHRMFVREIPAEERTGHAR